VDKTVLLFLPEGEHHELGLLFMYYMLKNRGIQTIYLGANVPVKDVAYVARLKKPDIVFTHLTATSSSFNFEKFLNSINSQFNDIQTVISGQLTHSYTKNIPNGIKFKKSLQEVMEYLTSL
jgi:methanogenic corrinoid protein MtbC1